MHRLATSRIMPNGLQHGLAHTRTPPSTRNRFPPTGVARPGLSMSTWAASWSLRPKPFMSSTRSFPRGNCRWIRACSCIALPLHPWSQPSRREVLPVTRNLTHSSRRRNSRVRVLGVTETASPEPASSASGSWLPNPGALTSVAGTGSNAGKSPTPKLDTHNFFDDWFRSRLSAQVSKRCGCPLQKSCGCPLLQGLAGEDVVGDDALQRDLAGTAQ